MIYYKFCSSMLSSTVDLQGELSQAPGNCRVDSPGAAQADHGIMDLQQTERNELKKACSLATAARLELRKQIRSLSMTTNWVSFMIKLLRAYGGCLGARRR